MLRVLFLKKRYEKELLLGRFPLDYFFDQKENTETDSGSDCIKNQVIDIRRSLTEQKLKNLNAKGDQSAYGYDFSKAIQFAADDWKNDAGWNEHSDISDDIDKHIPLCQVIKHADKWYQNDFKRQNIRSAKNKRLNFPVDPFQRKEHKTDDDCKIEVHQKKNGLPPPFDCPMPNPDAEPVYQPNSSKQQ